MERPRASAQGDPATGEERGGVTASELARSMVSLRKERTGRGPPKAHARIFDNCVICYSGEWMTTAEKTLRDTGKEEVIEQMRRSIREALSEDAVQMVESATNRRVITYLTDYDIERNVIVDLFVFDPNPDLGPRTIGEAAGLGE